MFKLTKNYLQCLNLGGGAKIYRYICNVMTKPVFKETQPYIIVKKYDDMLHIC